MKPTQSTLSILFCMLYCITLALDGYFYLHGDRRNFGNFLFNIIYVLPLFFGGMLGTFLAFRMQLSTTIGKAIFFLSLGYFSFTAGIIVWFYYNVVLQIPIPYPSVADLFFLLFIPTMGAGSILLLKTGYRKEATSQYGIEAGILTVIAAGVIFVFLNRHEITAQLPPFTRFIDLLYPIGDCTLLAIGYYLLRVTGGAIQKGVAILSIGLLLQAGADLSFSYMTAKGFYWNGSLPDLLYATADFVFALAMINLFFSFLHKTTPAPTATFSKETAS